MRKRYGDPSGIEEFDGGPAPVTCREYTNGILSIDLCAFLPSAYLTHVKSVKCEEADFPEHGFSSIFKCLECLTHMGGRSNPINVQGASESALVDLARYVTPPLSAIDVSTGDVQTTSTVRKTSQDSATSDGFDETYVW